MINAQLWSEKIAAEKGFPYPACHPHLMLHHKQHNSLASTSWHTTAMYLMFDCLMCLRRQDKITGGQANDQGGW